MDTVSVVPDLFHRQLSSITNRQVRAAVAHDIKIPPEFGDKTIIDTIVRVLRRFVDLI